MAGKLEPWRQVLVDAIGRIKERGWTQGAMCNDKGEVCLMGAVYDEWPLGAPWKRGSLSSQEIAHQDTAILKLEQHGYTPEWNDNAGRSCCDVIQALEEVATDPDL